jgi:hypothetical protein
MSLELAIFASVVLVLAVYHKQFRKFLFYAIAIGAALGAIGFGGIYLYDRYEAAKYEKHRQAVASFVERNRKNSGDIFDRVAATGKSLEEECESNTALMLPPQPVKAPEPGVVTIHGGETLNIVNSGEAGFPPKSGRVGSCISLFEACSAFTHVTACRLTESL